MSYEYTTNFGLVAIREQSPSAQDWAATYWNWINADKILWSLIAHHHDGAAALANPNAAPSLVAAETGGTLPASTTYYVAVSFIDSFGRETGPSSAAQVTTVAQIAAPATPTYVAAVDLVADADLPTPTGTGLAGGDYWYKLTYVKGSGETIASAPVYVNIPTDQIYAATIHFVSLTAAANGADKIFIYRKTGSTGNYVKMIEITAGATDSYTDGNTAVVNCDIQPPASNTTNSLNTVTVDISGVDTTGADYIKIYATTSNDGAATPLASFPNSTHLVTTLDMTVATPPTSYEWTGTALTLGKPLVTSQTLTNPSKIDLTSEVTGILPEINLPVGIGGITVYKLTTPSDGVAMLDVLPATADDGDAALIVSQDPDSGAATNWENRVGLFVWRANYATPFWERVNFALPTIDEAVDHQTSHTEEPGTMWLSKNGGNYFLNTRQSAVGISQIPTTVNGADGIQAYIGWLGVADDDISFYPAQPYYGYGTMSFVWNKKAMYYYEDTFSPDGGTEGWYKTGFSQFRGSFMSVANLPAIADDGDMALVRTDGAATPTTINAWYIYEGATPAWVAV